MKLLIISIFLLGSSLAQADEHTFSVGGGYYQDQSGNNYSLSQMTFRNQDVENNFQEVSALYNGSGFVAETFSFGRSTKNFYGGIVLGVMEQPSFNGIFGGQAGFKFNLFKVVNVRLNGEFGFNLCAETLLIGINF